MDNAVMLQGLVCFECCGVLEGRGIFGGAAVFFINLIIYFIIYCLFIYFLYCL